VRQQIGSMALILSDIEDATRDSRIHSQHRDEISLDFVGICGELLLVKRLTQCPWLCGEKLVTLEDNQLF
jgi:hypothetical protein